MKDFKQIAFYKNLHYFIFIVFIGFYLIKLDNVCSKYGRYGKVINEDAFGYYAILPALLKYQDPGYKFLENEVRLLPGYTEYIPLVVNDTKNGKKVSKYYCGVAFLQLPFYIAGNIIAKIRGQSVGFENTYHIAILLSVVFYLVLGFIQTLKLLILVGIKPVTASLILPLILFGSNLYCYTTYDMAYSHIYSFFALVFFIKYLMRLKSQVTISNAMFCGFFYGLIILIRPLNGIAILFVPIILNLAEFRLFFSRLHFGKTLFIILIVLLILSIQSILWYWQTGMFYVYPYGKEKLNLSDPKIWELVFGFNSGWAIYTPLPFLMLVFALLVLLKNKQYKTFFWSFFCSISVLYLISCWYYLHYGCTVGCRPITEFYGPIIILFACACSKLLRRKWFNLTFFSLSYLLVYYNQVIHYQFYENILNWCEMDKNKFKMVFMKTDQAYQYSTSVFWDFSAYPKSKDTLMIPVKRILIIDANKTNDTFTLQLPPLLLNDSLLLLKIRFNCRMEHEINESFLRFLISNKGDYIDLHNFLLKRKINTFNQVQMINYEFHVKKPLPFGKLHFSLESVDQKAVTQLELLDIQVNRIRF